MLNEFLEMFLGAFYNFIPVENPHREYFAAALSVGVLVAVCVGCLALAIVIVHGTFKAVRGLWK